VVVLVVVYRAEPDYGKSVGAGDEPFPERALRLAESTLLVYRLMLAGG
jgi:hypothetical protein